MLGRSSSTIVAFVLASLFAWAGRPGVSAPNSDFPPFLWEADTTFGSFADKAAIDAYLDDLKAHSVNGIWVQVEIYTKGSVNYKKTTLSGLPTLERFKTGPWVDDDFLSYVIAQAKSRNMQVMIKFHGSNDLAWDKNPDWRIRDSKGEEVLWSGRLKNFCVNSPYWDETFLPMLREIAANYDVDGFYLDTCQVAYSTSDSCFCVNCQSRFESETGKKLPMKSVDKENWADPAVKLHAVKRTEWLNRFWEKYAQEIERAKPGATALLNLSGCYNSYKDGLSARHAEKFVTYLTPEPVNTPRMYAVKRNEQRKKAGQAPLDERELAKEELIRLMTRYGYHEFMVKTVLADGAGKLAIPIARCWFISEDEGYMGPVDLEIAQIESAIGAGAKGYCFFGYLGSAIQRGKVGGTAWADPKYTQYLKDLTTGERAKWVADMQPDAKIGILYDRDADFWTGDYWRRLRSVGGVFSLLQYWKKVPVELIAASEPNEPGFGKSGYRLDSKMLERFRLVVAPGLDYVSKKDIETLRGYVEAGGGLLIMGSVGAYGKFLGGSIADDAYQMLGIATVGEPEPSGFVVKLVKHPVFTAVEGTGPFGSFRLSADKNDSWSYKPRFGDGWELLADEVNDSGRRACVLTKRMGQGMISYINSSEAAGFAGQMMQLIANLVVITSRTGADIMPIGFSPTSSVNVFRAADGLASYLHIFTPDGESNAEIRIRLRGDTTLVSAQIVQMDGKVEPLEMEVPPSGYATLRLPSIKPCFAMIKMLCKQHEPQ